MNFEKKPYKIEVWEDVYRRYDSPIIEKDEDGNIIKELYGEWDEVRSVRVGDSEIKQIGFAFEPNLVRDASGEITFTFSLYGYYYDQGQKINNYLVPYIFNEAKIKLQYDNKWYDFIVKEIKEKKDNKGLIYEYYCDYLPMVELAKNGWELNFSLEQENCIGTIEELTNVILEGTDWTYKPSKDCNLTEYNLEFLYHIGFANSDAVDDYGNPALVELTPIEDFYNGTGEPIQVPINITNLYSFYSEINSSIKEGDMIVIYGDLDSADKENAYTLLKGMRNYRVNKDLINWKLTDEGKRDIPVASPSKYYAYKVVETPKTIWSDAVERYVTVNDIYKNDELVDTYYGYSDSVATVEYTYDTTEENGKTIKDVEAKIVTKTFFYKKDDKGEIYKLTTESGFGPPKNPWSPTINVETPIQILQQPYSNSAKADIEGELPVGKKVSTQVYARSHLGDILTYKWYYKDAGSDNFTLDENQTSSIYEIEFTQGEREVIVEVTPPVEEETTEEGTTTTEETNTGTETEEGTETETPKTETIIEYYIVEDGRIIYCVISDEHGNSIETEQITFTVDAPPDNILTPEDYYNEYANKYSNKQVYINTEIDIGINWTIAQKYEAYPNYPDYNMYIWDNTKADDGFPVGWVFDKDLNGLGYAPGKDYIVLYSREEISSFGEIKVQYYPKAEKQRSLIEEKSNRFNLLQKLAELFEVWASFEIEHYDDGRIKKTDDGLPVKTVTYRTEIGKENWAGFSFDINLSSIGRTVDSKELTTKMWVEKIDNDNSEDGICSIQTAEYNIGGELFLINLEYYSQVGLIDHNELIKDLYGLSPDDFGYLKKLGEQNRLYSDISILLDGKDGCYIQLSDSKEKREFYNDSVIAADQELKELQEKKRLTDEARAKGEVPEKGLTHSEEENYESLLTELQNKKKEAERLRNEFETKVEVLEKHIEEEEKKLLTINQEKARLNEIFYNIYSRFLLEGTWQGSDYIEPNIYYYDANKVLLDSSRPSIEYDIEVYDVSSAIDYSNQNKYDLYNYDIGDITYIEDPDYFGYDETGRPYREKVVVATIENNLDNPSKNKITVKNFKTSFEDLFQRTTATVQSYNLNKNVYSRAANFEANGEISYDSLQNTLSNNNFILAASANNNVVIDSSGITVTSLGNVNSKVRVVAEGIFYAQDGENYHAAITGGGINTLALAAGVIDTEKINIKMGSFPTFSWDSHGINAYSWASANNTYQAYSRTVRFDQYGIYGINHEFFGVDNVFNPSHKYTYEQDSDGNIINIVDNGEITEGLTIDTAIDTIEKFSKFSLTWRGFKLKTNSGSVSITSENDFQVLQPIFNPVTNTIKEIERIKIGLLDKDKNLYGMKLFDAKGNPTLITTSAGNLGLTGVMYISASGDLEGSEPNLTCGNIPLIAIGNLGEATNNNGFLSTDETLKTFIGKERKILIQKKGSGKPSPQFVVFEDGSIYMAGGITAEYGDIGGFIIGSDNLSSENGNIILSSNDGINLTGKTFSISNINGEQTLYADENGNIIGNNVTMNGGTFNNIEVVEGNFTGSLTATKGFIEGDLVLGDKIKAFEWPLGINVDYEEVVLEDGDKYLNYFINANNNDNIKANTYYYTFINENNEDRLLLFRTGETENNKNKFYYVKNNINDLDIILENILTILNEQTPEFYEVADNNIVLNGSTGTIFNFNYYKNNEDGFFLSGDGEVELRNDRAAFNFNDGGLAIQLNTNQNEEAIGKYFTLDNNGRLTTSSISITGNTDNFIIGKLTVGKNNGIIIDGENGSIYNASNELSLGSRGWSINSSGSAVFNDITIRGQIGTAVFTPTSTQAISGSLLVRPALTFQSDSTILNLGNNIYQAFINETLSNWGGSFYYIEYNDCNYFFSIESYDEAQKMITLSVLNTMDSQENYGGVIEISDEILGELVTKPLINAGNINNKDTIGISINAENTNTPFGFKESITIFNSSLDENYNITRENKIVLGHLPEVIVPSFMKNEDDIDKPIFGLYADNVYLNGAMVSVSDNITAGISTKEKNGNIFWAGATGDTAEDINAAPFKVTSQGYMYAKNGYFGGEIEASIIKTSQIIGKEKDNDKASLRVLTYPDATASISFEQYNNDIQDYLETARLSSQSFKIAAPLMIYGNKQGLIDSTLEPSLLSLMDHNTIAIKDLITYNLSDSDAYGWGIREKELYFRQITNSSEYMGSKSDRIKELVDSSTGKIVSLGINNNNDSLSIKIDEQDMLSVERGKGTEIYQNLFLTNSIAEEEGTQVAFKLAYDTSGTVIGYDLVIEEK